MAWLPVLLGLPALGAIGACFFPKSAESAVRAWTMIISISTFVFSVAMLKVFDFNSAQMQLVFDMPWIPGLGARFKLGVDGISILLIILTTFLMPVIFLSSFSSITKKVKEFCVVMLFLQTGMIGAFLSLDIFLFYVFWEIMLIPMYLLIGIWGGKRRHYASIKFVLYTMVGSLLMLVAIFYLYAQHGNITGTYTTELSMLDAILLSPQAQIWCFAAFALAFAIKVPLFPLHTWLPDAHVEAPTVGSVVLAGVLLKLGIYGFLRFAMPLFPYGAAVLAPWIAWLSVIGIVYGAFVAFAQTDVKKLVAYSSVSHLGFCMLGLFSLTALGIEGSIFAMVSHGLTTSGLFLAIGVVYERRHTRELSEFGGLWTKMPIFAGLFLICTFGSAGLPGLSGFIGEFLTILGTFVSGDTFPTSWPHYLSYPMLLAAIAATGVIFGAVYLLYMFQKMMLGPLDNEKNQELEDVNTRELFVFLPLVVMIFVMGVFPRPFLKIMEPSVKSFIAEYKSELEDSTKVANAPKAFAFKGQSFKGGQK